MVDEIRASGQVMALKKIEKGSHFLLREKTWRDYMYFIVRGRLRSAWRLRKCDKIIIPGKGTIKIRMC